VLHTVAGEHLDAAIVHGDGKVNDDFTRGRAENLPESFVEIELARRVVETGALGLPGVDFLIEGYRRG
jgi:hypothetical protein